MKPFWKKQYRDQFFELAGLWLLYAFIASICANPIIMYFVGIDKFYYVNVESYSEPIIYDVLPTGEIKINNTNVFSKEQQEQINKYKLVDEQYIYNLKRWQNNISWLIITALLGWCVTSPRFNRGFPKLLKLLRENND